MSVPPPGGSQQALRRANRDHLTVILRSSGPLTQADLAERTGLAASSVSAIVRELEAAGVVGVANGIRNGRRARTVRLNPGGVVAGGFDFGRTHVRVALVDFSLTPLGDRLVEYDAGTSAETALALAVEAFADLRTSSGADRARLVGVGAGVPGPVDTSTGLLGHGAIVPEWVGTHPAEALAEAVAAVLPEPVPAYVDNDANLGALAEHTLGLARGHDTAVYLKIETGVGAGLVVGGQVVRGGVGMAGEIGHLSVDETGPLCRCGGRGCLEVRASVAVALRTLHVERPHLTAESVAAMAAGGDPGCARVVSDIGRDVGVALGAVCNLLNPTLIVIDTTLSGAGDVLLEPMRASLRRFAIPAVAAAVDVTFSELDGRAPALGAALLALEHATIG